MKHFVFCLLLCLFGLGMVALAYVDGYEKRQACADKDGVLVSGGGYAAPDVCLIGFEKAVK